MSTKINYFKLIHMHVILNVLCINIQVILTANYTCHCFFTHLLVPRVSALLFTAGRFIYTFSNQLASEITLLSLTLFHFQDNIIL